MSELKPCPFCGGEASIKRMGTSRVSMQIECLDCNADVETGETWINENSHWNARESDKEIATLKAERDDWREQAQRNDIPVKSAAEIGRDAILEAVASTDRYMADSRVMFRLTDLKKYANNLTANSGES